MKQKVEKDYVLDFEIPQAESLYKHLDKEVGDIVSDVFQKIYLVEKDIKKIIIQGTMKPGVSISPRTSPKIDIDYVATGESGGLHLALAINKEVDDGNQRSNQ